MSRVLPILFNTEMVQAIMDGRKTVTRRILKHDTRALLNSPYCKTHPEVPDKQIIEKLCKSPYEQGDVLYVRETWCSRYDGEKYFYLADKCTKREEKKLLDYGEVKWRPSIHMPKEAARIFLKVKDVRVERLQDITDEGAYREGAGDKDVIYQTGARVLEFAKIWDSTIKKSDIEKYGWNATPWVWVIEFERCEKPEGGNEKRD